MVVFGVEVLDLVSEPEQLVADSGLGLEVRLLLGLPYQHLVPLVLVPEQLLDLVHLAALHLHLGVLRRLVLLLAVEGDRLHRLLRLVVQLLQALHDHLLDLLLLVPLTPHLLPLADLVRLRR